MCEPEQDTLKDEMTRWLGRISNRDHIQLADQDLRERSCGRTSHSSGKTPEREIWRVLASCDLYDTKARSGGKNTLHGSLSADNNRAGDKVI